MQSWLITTIMTKHLWHASVSEDGTVSSILALHYCLEKRKEKSVVFGASKIAYSTT
jgi:hypothetical protein